MATIYVQGSDSLIEYGNVTAEKIIAALGYTPADASKLAAISETDNTAMSVADKDGNIITKTDGDGFHAAEVYIGDENEEKTVSEMITEAVAGLDVDYTESDPTVPAWAKAPNKPSYTASEVGAIPDDGTINTGEDDIYAVTDKNGNVIFKADGDGVDAAQYKANGSVVKCIVSAENDMLLFSDGTEMGVGANAEGCTHEYITLSGLDIGEDRVLQYCSKCGKTRVTRTSIDKLTFTENGAYCTVAAKDTSISGEIIIPSTYNGLPVTEIADSGFENCTLITVITIPDSVTSIYSNAFKGCTSLNTINIGSGVTLIAPSVFDTLPSLTTIVIPENVTNMGDNFYNCASDLTIYCEATSKPDGWIDNWCNTDCTIVWAYGQPTYNYTIICGTGAACLEPTGTIAAGETASITVNCLTGYTLSVKTITNAKYTFLKNDPYYTLELFNATGDVTVEISGSTGTAV